MPSVIHIIDRTTHHDMLMQVKLLSAPGDMVVSLGQADNSAILGMPVHYVHEPMGCARLGGYWLARHEHISAPVFHAWSIRSAAAAQAGASSSNGLAVISVPYVASDKDFDSLARLTCRGCCVTVPTRIAAEKLLSCGAMANSVFVLPPCANEPSDVSDKRLRIRQQLDIGDDQHLLVMLGEIDHNGGYRLGPWVQAVAHQIRDDVRLVIAGEGKAKETLRHFIVSSGYPDEAFLTGWNLDNDDVLCAGDIMLHLPTSCAGVWPIAAGMFAGLATVCSDTPESREIAGDSALVVRRDDPRQTTAAVLGLLQNPSKTRDLARSARERARGIFDRKVIRPVLDAIYKKHDPNTIMKQDTDIARAL